MNDDSPRDARLTETAQAIHADNLHLLARLDADDCNPGIELDCTLNGAQEHIFAFFEALAAYRHGEVPWRGVSFMIDSTNALVRTLESRYGMASAHAVGQAFRASKVWWCVDESAPRLPRKAYLKHLVAAREAIYDALNTLNCELFVRTARLSAARRDEVRPARGSEDDPAGRGRERRQARSAPHAREAAADRGGGGMAQESCGLLSPQRLHPFLRACQGRVQERRCALFAHARRRKVRNSPC